MDAEGRAPLSQTLQSLQPPQPALQAEQQAVQQQVLQPITPGRRPRTHWSIVLRDTLSTYLPILLMLVLAGGTFWFVRNAPLPPQATQGKALPTTPDYTLQQVRLQRFASDGRQSVLIEGAQLRHYPADDRIELDEIRLTSTDEQGRVTNARARRGETNAAGTQARLMGQAQVQREASADQAAFRIEGEELKARTDIGRVESELPVRMHQEGLTVLAAGLVYDRDRQFLDLMGPVRAVIEPKARKGP